MGNPSGRRATYDDLLGVPENQLGEIIDGQLIAQPWPGPLQARAVSQLMGEVAPVDRDAGAWIVLIRPELHLLGDALVPDLAGWRRERMPQLLHVAALELAPDWVCEVLSPSTQSHKCVKKMGVYARERVAHIWLVDPLAQTLEVYAWSERAWLRIQVAQGAEKCTQRRLTRRSSS